ncbi:MAG: N-acetylmuramoyl-L-alanine amidase [Lachnospira sp.]
MKRNEQDIRNERRRRRKRRRMINLAIKIIATGVLLAIVLTVAVVAINAGKSNKKDSYTGSKLSDKQHETETEAMHTKKIVILDAGHGGVDVGTNYNTTYEKDINLAIVKRIQGILASYSDELEVVLTRNSDVKVSLDNRSVINNSYDTDLFVSVHVNSNEDSSSINGVDIYYQEQRNDGSDNYAAMMLSSIAAKGITTRYTHPANFSVLRNSNSPAILIETGYITNAKDREMLATASYQQQMAEAIADGILDILLK